MKTKGEGGVRFVNVWKRARRTGERERRVRAAMAWCWVNGRLRLTHYRVGKHGVDGARRLAEQAHRGYLRERSSS